MKFGAKLRAYAVPEWQGAYVRYGALKAVIKRYEAELREATRKQEEDERRRRQELQQIEGALTQGDPQRLLLPHISASGHHVGDTSLQPLHGDAAEGLLSSSEERASQDISTAEERRPLPGGLADAGLREVVQRVQQKAIDEFDALLEAEVQKVEFHFWEKLRIVRDRLGAVEDELELLDPSVRVRRTQSFTRRRSEESEHRVRRRRSSVSTERAWQSSSSSVPLPSSSVPREDSSLLRGEHARERELIRRSGKDSSKRLEEVDTSRLVLKREVLSNALADRVSSSPPYDIERENHTSDKDGKAPGIAPLKMPSASTAGSAHPRLRDRDEEIRGPPEVLSPLATKRTRASQGRQTDETFPGQEGVPRYPQDTEGPSEALPPRESAGVSHEGKHRDDGEVQNVYSVGDDNGKDGLLVASAKATGSRGLDAGAETSGDSSRRIPETEREDYGPSFLRANTPSIATSARSEDTSAVDNVYKPMINNGGHEVFTREREAHITHLRRLQRVIVSMLDTFEKLQGFANLNLICVYKILKKRDKRLGTQLMRESFAYYETRLNALVVPKLMKTTIVSLYRRTCRAVGQEDGLTADGSLYSFHRLQMAVQKDMLSRRANFAASRSRTLYFSMGCVCTLFVNILILAWRTATNPNFRQATLLAYLPIYRFVFVCNFATLACAFSMAWMEAYGVNYKFLLDIDPKSQVDSTTIFGLATLQQLIFFFVFAVFLLDYKFAVFGKHHLYWMYMPTLIVLQLLLLALPHPTFRLTYRKHVLYTIERVFRAGFLLTPDVTLLQNLVGDALTSFSKPLGDLEYLFCFYATGLDHAAKPQCAGEGWIRPVLVGIPFYLRLCQCICRYRTGKGDAQAQRLHLLNCGKYISGILVIVCNSIPWQRFGVSPYSMCLIWVCSYVCATIYMFFWDVKMDWGLMPDPDHFLRLYVPIFLFWSSPSWK